MLRRGSSFYRKEVARMIDQFEPGTIVVPTFIASPADGLKGIVESVNKVENKVYVAWNGGPVKQHDPDEIMVAARPYFKQQEQGQASKDIVQDNPIIITASAKLPSYLEKKWKEVKEGKEVVVSDSDMDKLSDYFNSQDNEEATKYFNDTRTIHNPNQLGTKDKYIMSIKKASITANCKPRRKSKFSRR